VQFLIIGLQLPPEQEHNLGQRSDAGYVWIVTTIQLSKFIATAMEELLTDNSTKPLQRKHHNGTRQDAAKQKQEPTPERSRSITL